MPAERVPVTSPKYALPALTSYELRDYRRQLERAIEGISPSAPVQAAAPIGLGEQCEFL